MLELKDVGSQMYIQVCTLEEQGIPLLFHYLTHIISFAIISLFVLSCLLSILFLIMA